MRFLIALFALPLLPLANPAVADAAPECQVLVLRPITDDIGNHWNPGQKLPVDIQRSGPNGGAYCAHGGSCLPGRIGGAEAVRLVNCRVGASIDSEDRRLVFDPHVTPAQP